MSKRTKLWSSMQVVTFAGLTTLGACSTDSQDEDKNQIKMENSATSEGVIIKQEPTTPTEGEGGGENE